MITMLHLKRNYIKYFQYNIKKWEINKYCDARAYLVYLLKLSTEVKKNLSHLLWQENAIVAKLYFKSN